MLVVFDAVAIVANIWVHVKPVYRTAQWALTALLEEPETTQFGQTWPGEEIKKKTKFKI